MKRTDLSIWGAILLLIALVLYLIFVSAQTAKHQQQQINKLQVALQNLPSPKDGYTPVKGIDYFDGQDGLSIKGDKGNKGDQGPAGPAGSSCSIVQEDSGAMVVCADGSQATIANGAPGPAGRQQEQRCGSSGVVETRFSGDIFWQQTNILCEAADDRSE